MSVIDQIMSNDTAKWIDLNIQNLPNRAKFRAASSIRALHWASTIYKSNLPIPASFCALHATEEAVAAFISCAKVCGYGEDAKINLKDHRAKASVSLLVQIISETIQEIGVSFGYMKGQDEIASRVSENGAPVYGIASLKNLHVLNAENTIARDFYDIVLSKFDSVKELKIGVRELQESRNNIFYADSKSLPSGFDNPEASLRKECLISLGCGDNLTNWDSLLITNQIQH